MKKCQDNYSLDDQIISKIMRGKKLTRIYFEGCIRACWCETSEYTQSLNVKDTVNITYDICRKGIYTQTWIRTMMRTRKHISRN